MRHPFIALLTSLLPLSTNRAILNLTYSPFLLKCPIHLSSRDLLSTEVVFGSYISWTDDFLISKPEFMRFFIRSSLEKSFTD